ncbi:fatty acid synthase S-acetyltransferase [Pyricularia oryzae]|nr:fatty acid synthase S-acetyltransferase [Pyricularia oryzae]KAI7916820.1 fatty acid synthase S-acetyltransferase [Pyricularia oryzae]
MAPSRLYNFSSSGTSPTSSSAFTVPSVANSETDSAADMHPPMNGHRQFDGFSDPGMTPRAPMPIAIVGMACRMPGSVATPAEFWELCSRARSGYTKVPKERFNHDLFYHPNPGKTGAYHAQGGNFLDVDLAAFDAPFFGLTEKEAISMDPQQRLLLECTFEALENAGVPKHSIVGKDVGVFVGGSFAEYESHLFRDSDTIPMHQATGCAHAMQSNRLSHFFDLRGPSFTADTACSASLVALHLACQSLRSGESSSAIVGSCHLNMLPEFFVSFSTCRLLSDTGRSIAFDERGTGFGRGEGCGIIILKPLDQAVRDNDTIRAVIMGTGINQDGKTPGITMPSGEAQEKLINQVYNNFGLDPMDCGYVEAHGTGTKVGDPIEATALHNALGQGRTAADPLFIGSVKSNIGHLEAASGLAGVIKAALMLERGFILPNHDFKKPNPKIPWKQWHMTVARSQRPWPRGKKYISVNNFGFGGTNAHVVLAKAPFTADTTVAAQLQNNDSRKPKQTKKLIVLTANDKDSLAGVMKKLVIYLEQRPEVFQADLMRNVAYTLGQRRSHLQWRLAVPVSTSFELVDTLNSGKVVSAKMQPEAPRIGFVFTGQGAQWHGMGRELYDSYPVYAAAMDRADAKLKELGATWSLLEELSKDGKTSKVSEAHISQPACTAVQLAITDLLKSWGVVPVAVAGHSSGEICAAYAAGIINFDSAVAIAYHRGRLIPVLKSRHPDLAGGMMAVGGSESDMQPMIDAVKRKQQEVRIACFNSPSSLTISGDASVLNDLERVIEEEQPEMFRRKLQVDVAYHSHHMNLVADEYRDSIEHLSKPRNTDVQFHSSLFGKRVEGYKCTASYWVENLTCPVRFSEALSGMLEAKPEDGVSTLIEIGPHSALQGPIKQILAAAGRPKLPYASALVRNKDAVDTALDLAGNLFMKGAFLNMDAVNFPSHLHAPATSTIPLNLHTSAAKQPTLLTDLPRYVWNHSSKYWHESRMTEMHKFRKFPRNDLIGVEAIYSTDVEPTWRNIVALDDLPWLRHHRIQSLTIFPFSGFVAMALEAAAQQALKREAKYDRFELRRVVVSKPLAMGDGDVEMDISLRPHSDSQKHQAGWRQFRIASWTKNGGWAEHCTGEVAALSDDDNEVDGERQKQAIRRRVEAASTMGEDAVDVAEVDMYNCLEDLGVTFGAAFQGVKACKASNTKASADIVATDIAVDMPNHYMTESVLHPSVLESLVQMYWPILGAGRTSPDTVYLPSSVGKVSISREVTAHTNAPGKTIRAFGKAEFAQPCEEPRATSVSVMATTQDGQLLVEIEDLKVAPIIDGEGETDSSTPRELCYKLEWEQVLKPALVNGTPADSNTLPEAEIVIVHGDTAFQHTLARALADIIEKATSTSPVAMGTLGHIETEGKVCIVLTEIDMPFLADPTEQQFEAVQKLIGSVQGLLWVVRGAYDKATSPDSNMVCGLSRSVRSETLLPFATLDLDSIEASTAHVSKSILDVFKIAFNGGLSATKEMEFMERGGKLFTPRILDDAETNAYVHKRTNPDILEKQPFAQEGRQLKMVGGKTLHFVDATIDTLGADEVEIEVKAVGVNASDAQQLAKSTAESPAPVGSEAAGIVTRVGANVTSVKKGDRVAALTLSSGAYSTVTRASAANTIPIPQAMDFSQAATLPFAYVTAHHALEQARLSSGQSVLIHSAASAVGQAAVCLAQLRDAEVFVTVSSAAEKKLIMTKFSVSEDRIFYNRGVGFGSAIREATAGEGVDVVISIRSDAEVVRESWDCLDRFGCLVNVSEGSSRLDLSTDGRPSNASFVNVDIQCLAAERPAILKRLVDSVAKLVGQGQATPVEATVFAVSEVQDALKSASKTSCGKSVVVLGADDMVMATPSKVTKKILRSDGTYLLIGGTGGLGRSMAKWMVDNGAGNVVLLSRSGSATGQVKQLIDAASEAGSQVIVKRCDVANKASVDELFKGLSDLPPVRGIVHGAMVLRDVLFEKMAYTDYTTVIESKVAGAWNFHHALAANSCPVDFFIAISSAAGAVGNRGQAAYAAANTFLNALVQHRLAAGLPAASLDLTAVSDAGYLADGDAERAAEVAKNLGADSTICEAEVLALIGACIEGKTNVCNGHVITGMRIPPTPTKPFWATDAKFKTLRLTAEAAELAANGGDSATASLSPGAAVKAATSLAEAEEAVCAGLVDKISSVLMMEADEIDVTRSLTHYPLDSLVAIEIRNFITREFEANMQVLELLSSGSVQTLTKAVCKKSKLCVGLS